MSMTIMCALAATGTSARAQRAPDLATLDRGDGITRIGLDMGLVVLDAPGYDAALRLDLFGQYVSLSGLGFYGSVPVSMAFGDDDNDATALGNIDVGGLYVLETTDISWVFRLGIALPTADDDPEGFAANFFAIWPRFTDLAQTVPDATYVRFGFSPLIHMHNVFLRADLGFDLAVNDGDAFEADSLFRLNIGGGVDLGPVALGVESVNLASLDDFDDDDVDDEERFLHVLAVTLRFMGESLQPFVAVGAPLDDFVREDPPEGLGVNLFVAAGIQVAF